MPRTESIDIEGFTPDEILAIPDAEIGALLLTGEPVVFQAGTACVLGQFSVSDDCLSVELSHIDGGGEGVLPTLWLLAERFAKGRECTAMEWIVHAVNCAHPNLKLRRILDRKGFKIRIPDGGADVYFKRTELASS
ncbi:MAG TPA: hypothetical protein VGM51_19260 [Armatimonadota bacterium]|jgi:hypothetical protein